MILITGTLGLGTSLSLICNVANGHSCVVIRQSVREIKVLQSRFLLQAPSSLSL